ncbi:MAG TPA: HupE/UreJ family protein, partial [Luteolibacter sp.]|nr:HupE/UreJ family protein [Luteolibacter sp.]
VKLDAPTVFIKRPKTPDGSNASKQEPKPVKTSDKNKPAVSGLQAFGSWVVSGFRHVLPLGLDHMLFIFGLFVAVLSLRPMWWQSLLFTLAHSLTLALCALGWIALDAKLVEILIALSIAFIGIEDLCGLKVGKRRYVLVVLFGLVHGMGFANVLAEKIHGLDKTQLVKPLLGFNLGVEIAQIVVILLSAMLFALVPKKHKKTAQRIGAAIVALGGLAWLVLRAKDYF